MPREYCSINSILDHKTCQHEAEDGSDVDDRAFAFALGFRQFVGIDTLEFTRGILAVVPKAFTENTCQRIALNFPELSYLDTRRIELQGGTHR